MLAMLGVMVELELASRDFNLVSVFVGCCCGDRVDIDVVELVVDFWAPAFVDKD